MNLAPIVLFVYNRPEHTTLTLEALSNNLEAQESDLFVFADGPKINASEEEIEKINRTREIVHSKSWCKTVTVQERSSNIGLASSIILGVTKIVDQYGKVIVLEDDIVTSKMFLNYMNKSLNYYYDNKKVMHISAYFPPIKKKLPHFFFYNQTSCWGWGTWKSSWEHFDDDTEYLYSQVLNSGRLDYFNIDNSYPFMAHLEANLNGSLKTWAIKWHASVFLNNGLCLHPNKSYVRNIGFDDSGTNCTTTEIYDIALLNDNEFRPSKILKEDINARKTIKDFNNNANKDSLLKRTINKIKRNMK